MKVSAIRFKDENKEIHLIEEGYLKRDKGLEDDVNSKGGDRQISILSLESRDYLDNNETKGLCYYRFYENITIEGLNTEELAIGDHIKIDESIQQITEMGKECFKECGLFNSKEICPLSTDVIYTKVLKSGIINVGETVTSFKPKA